MVKQADRLVVMTRSHRHAVLAHYPEAAERTTLIRTDDQDVVDPIGGTLEDYAACAKMMEEHLTARLDEWDVGPARSS